MRERKLPGVETCSPGSVCGYEQPVTCEKVMEFLDCTQSYVYDLMAKNVIPSHKVGGRRYFYLSEIDRAIKAL